MSNHFSISDVYKLSQTIAKYQWIDYILTQDFTVVKIIGSFLLVNPLYFENKELNGVLKEFILK